MTVREINEYQTQMREAQQRQQDEGGSRGV